MLTVKPFVGSAGEAFFSCLFHNLNVLAFLLLLLIVLGWLAVLWLLLRGLGSIIFSLLLLLDLVLLTPTPSVPVAFFLFVAS